VRRDGPLLAALAMTGLAALALEVIWSRALLPWVGGTALAQVATVATYMIGLFAGSAAAAARLPRIADARAWFVRAEVAAALLSLAAVVALPLADPLFALFSRGDRLGSAGGSLLRGFAGGGLMLPATLLMGFGFPLAIAAVDRGRGERGSAALAYGVNTIGATAGALLAGFALVPRLGVTNGAVAVVLLDLALLAWVARTSAPEGAAPGAGRDPARAPPPPGSWRDELPMLASLLAGGMVALGLQAILFRVLGLLLGPTARAFTVVVAVYVLGLGIGSLLVRRWVGGSRGAAERVYLACWAVVGLYGLVVHAQAGTLSRLVAESRGLQGRELGGALALRALIAALVLLPITSAFGASWSAAVASARLVDARRAGRLYAALTLGNVLGLFAAASWVMPRLRLDRALLLALAAALLVPLAALPATTLRRRTKWAAAPLLAAGAAIAWTWMPSWPLRLLHTAAYAHGATQAGVEGGDAVVRSHRSAFETSVSVVQIGESLYLQLDGKTTGSTDEDDQATQGMLGALPAALHPAPRRAFVIGLGTGQTAAELLRHPLERVDCAEISPEVVLALPFFAAINRRCELDARLRLLAADGRTVLRYGSDRYDLVVSEPSNVWIPGVAHLFTRESFEEARERLAPGGLCVQWLQGYGLQVETLRMVVRTFLRVFPETSLWFSGLARPDLLLVGAREPLRVEVGELERRLRAAGAVNVSDHGRPLTAVALLRRHVAGPERLREFAGDGPLTRDARPGLEYAAEAALLGGSTDPARGLIAELCEPPLDLLRPGGAPPDPATARTLQRRAEANRAVSRLLAELDSGGGRAPDETIARLLALPRLFEDDRELHASIVAAFAFPLAARHAEGDRSSPLLEVMRRVIEVDPDHPEALGLALRLAAAQGRPAEMLALADRLRAASPPWRVEPELHRGRALLALGRHDEALACLERATQLSPHHPDGWREYGRALAASGDRAGAEAAARRLRELLDPRE